MNDDLMAFSYIVVFLAGVMLGAAGLWCWLLLVRAVRLMTELLQRLVPSPAE